MTIEITAGPRPDFTSILAEVVAHASETPDRECCGLVTAPRGKMAYRRCRNVAHGAGEFEIHPEDYIAAEADCIIGVVHSHLHGSPEPSMADKVGVERSGLPWLIVSLPNGAYRVVEPSGFEAPLLGRPFVHNVFDCFSLARDYYAGQGIEVLDFERTPNWWEGEDDLLTPENFAKAGFVIVSDGTLQAGDGIIMQNGKVDKPNHVGVYLGDGVMLHHPGERLSHRTPYGGYWQKVTRWIVRHCSKC